MEILNIDAFAQTTRQISMGGKTYPVEEPTVQQFIDNLKIAEALEKSAADNLPTMSGAFESAVKTIQEAIPTLPEAEIRKLKLPAMTAVLQFVRGEVVDKAPGVTETVRQESAEEGAEAKKPD